MAEIKVKLVRSRIGSTPAQRKLLDSLGLKRREMVKTFKDTPAIRGIIAKLPYLKTLGITMIWVSPFYRSPDADNGYDIADYYNIHPDYGTLRDFRQFVRQAHRRGIRVITELVSWRAAFLIKGDVLEEPADHEPQERRQQRIARDAAQEEPCGESEDVVIPFRVAVAEPVGARVPPDEVQAVGPQRQQGFARAEQPQLGKYAITLIDDTIPILIKLCQIGKAVAGKGAEQLPAVVDGAVAVAVQGQEGGAPAEAGHRLLVAVRIQVEVEAGVVQIGDQSIQRRRQRAAHFCQHNLTRSPIEQLQAEFTLQLRDRAADRWLRQTNRVAGPTEAVRTRHCQEDAQLAQSHIHAATV